MSRVARTSIRLLIVGVCMGMAIVVAAPSHAYLRPGLTERVSVTSEGRQTDNAVWPYPTDITPDGRYVVFTSLASNVVPGDTNLIGDVFVHDRKSGTTKRVSVASDGSQAISEPSGDPQFIMPGFHMPHAYGTAISATGRYVAFLSLAPNLVPEDTNRNVDVFVHDRRSGSTERVSIKSNGDQTCVDQTYAPNACAWPADLSADGRYVAFDSLANDVVPDDTNGRMDVFVHDRRTRETERVSTGSLLDGFGSGSPSLSGDGRYVVFGGGDLVAGARGGEIHIHDRRRGTTQMLVQGSNLVTGRVWLQPGKAISSDGRYIVFVSTASGFVPNDQNRADDVFVYDRETKRIERVSVSSAGEETASELPTKIAHSYAGSIGPEGQVVAFESYYPFDDADGLANVNQNIWDQDVFAYDRRFGSVEWISVAPDGTDPHDPESPENGWSAEPSLSEDGRFVAFMSDAPKLVQDDTNGDVMVTGLLNGQGWDAFVRDRGTPLGVGGLSENGKLTVAGATGFSSEGFIFSSDPATDLNSVLSEQGGNLIGMSLAHRAQYQDLFARIQLEDMPMVAGTPVFGNPGILYGLSFTADETNYQVRVQRVPGPDYVEHGGASFGLFTQDPLTGIYTKMAALRGGYGTTGEEVVFSLPLNEVGLDAGGELSDVSAFTAVGGYYSDALKILDEVAIAP